MPNCTIPSCPSTFHVGCDLSNSFAFDWLIPTATGDLQVLERAAQGTKIVKSSARNTRVSLSRLGGVLAGMTRRGCNALE